MPRSIRALFGAYLVISWIPFAQSFPLMAGSGAEASMKVRRHVSPFVSSDDGESDEHVASCLVILNGPISRPPSRIFQHLWGRSNYRICADGGANRLFDATVTTSDTSSEKTTPNNVYLPDKIKGDLDSLRSDVREHYENLGVDVERDRCQDTNDLDKCLQTILAQSEADSSKDEAIDKNKKTNVYIYGAFGGRFDQEMASMQALYRWADAFSYRLVLYTDETCAFLLPDEQMNEIKLANIGETDGQSDGDNRPMGEGVTCGLIPIGCRCDSATTTGLKWNLDGDCPLEFGGLVSTSNRIVEDVVTVKSSQPLVFTTEMIS